MSIMNMVDIFYYNNQQSAKGISEGPNEQMTKALCVANEQVFNGRLYNNQQSAKGVCEGPNEQMTKALCVADEQVFNGRLLKQIVNKIGVLQFFFGCRSSAFWGTIYKDADHVHAENRV